jgi:hypothetical protein
MNRIPSPAVDALRLGEMSSEEWVALASLGDPVGVLSACVDFSSGGRQRAEAEVRPVVASMADDVPGGDISRDRWRSMVDSALEGLLGAVEADVEPGERGRAVFWPISNGHGAIVRSASPVPSHVVIGRRPYLRALASVDAGSALTAVVGVTHGGVTITEFWGRYSRAEWSVPIDEGATARRLQGPSRSRLEPGSRAQVHGDLVDDRRQLHLERAIRTAIEHVVGQARRRGWASVVVGGDVRDATIASEALIESGVPALIHPRHVQSPRERQAALAMAADDRQRRAGDAVAEFVESLDADRAVVGAGDTVEAIEAGRARRIVMAAPGSAPMTGLPPSPLVNLEDIGRDDALEGVVWSAMSGSVPLLTVSGDAVQRLPTPYVGAFLE